MMMKKMYKNGPKYTDSLRVALQQFLEPLVPSAVTASAAAAAERAAERQAQGIRSWSARLNLVIEVCDLF